MQFSFSDSNIFRKNRFITTNTQHIPYFKILPHHLGMTTRTDRHYSQVSRIHANIKLSVFFKSPGKNFIRVLL